MQWRLIESDEALQQLLNKEAGSGVVIVDTEFMRRNTFYPEVGLVQLCFESESVDDGIAWLVDPLCINDPEPLAQLLTNANVLKVLHSASEDMEVFQRWLGVLPQPLFDTQRAAAILDIGFGLGYRALVQTICSVDLPKGETRSDWLQRPLTESQCEYAALDVTWLLRVWREINIQCQQQGKLDWVLADGEYAVSGLSTDVNDMHKRIKSAWKLSARQLGILVAICRWREETAKGRNKPRSWIIDDQTCLQLAIDDPETIVDLREVPGLREGALRRYGEELLQIVARQRLVPESDLPMRLPAPLDAGQRAQVKALKKKVREHATRLAIAPEVLVYSKDYELLLREAGGERILEPPHWAGWRAEAVVNPLRQMLAGRGS